MFNVLKPKRDAIPNWQALAYDRVKQAVEIYFGAPTRMRSVIFLTTSSAAHKDGSEARVVTLVAFLRCDKALPCGSKTDRIEARFLIKRAGKNHEWSFGEDTCRIVFGPENQEWYQIFSLDVEFTYEHDFGQVVPLVNVQQHYHHGVFETWDRFWRTGHHLGDRVVQPREYRTIDENVA